MSMLQGQIGFTRLYWEKKKQKTKLHFDEWVKYKSKGVKYDPRGAAGLK